jgi:hypothetical protein
MPDHPMRPWVQVAAICGAALVEQANFLSIIRIIDRLPLQGFTPQMQPQPLHNMALVIVLKSGDMRIKCQLKVTVETPSQKTDLLFETAVLFEGDERGVQVVTPLAYVANEEGLYWFNVILEPDDVLTRIPFRVMYQKIQPMPGMPFPVPPES